MNLKAEFSKFPSLVRRLIKAISFCADKNNFKVYLVGGVVRDLILGKPNFDLDIVVEGDAISFAKILSEYLGVDFRKHHSFGTATLFSSPHRIDLATCRREYYPYWGALPRVEAASLFEDLRRRDFTINALALSLNRDNFGELIDYFGGFSDLEKRIIRVLHPVSFLEDPTRILRAIKFKERFKFRFSYSTYRLLKEAVEKKALKLVSLQRLRDELELILKEEKPLRVIRTLNRLVGFDFLGINSLEREDFYILKRIEEALCWYRDNFPENRGLDDWLVYLMGLLRKLSLRKTKVLIDKLGLRRGERIRILTSKKLNTLEKLSKSLIPSKVYKILESFSFETIIFFYALAFSNRLAKENIRIFLSRLNRVRLDIRGRDLQKLGVSPSTIYGKVFKRILYKKIDGKINSKEEEIVEALRLLKK